MKLIIFEGIASSGKTTLERLLADKLPNSKIVTEGDTLMPLIENRDQVAAIDYLRKLITVFKKETADYLIIDRFHLTHAFRSHASLKEFSSIEESLRELGETLLVLLTIDTDSIKARIEETMSYRRDQWKKGAQGTLEEKAIYYAEQQEQLKRFQQVTTLPSIIIDTTNKDWENCLLQIEDTFKR
ncbi:MAG: hypothetical protein KBA81_07895 [Rhabdochlamydiaceae bacterium]|nr:hypothetical protein [Rhabdochlamydiaceae bacterium]